MSNRLEPKILGKLTKKIKIRDKNVSEKNIQDRVYRLGQKLGISSEAALVILAKKNKVNTGIYERKLEPNIRVEIRDNISNKNIDRNVTTSVYKDTEIHKNQVQISDRILIKSSIEYLIKDAELRERCVDLLMAKRNFDRAINQATLILEDRIRKKAPPPTKMVGVPLVNYVFNSDLTKTVLKVSDNTDEQDGFCSIIRGVMLAFRNLTHHHVVNKFSREYALSVCTFIDVLLQVVNHSQKIR